MLPRVRWRTDGTLSPLDMPATHSCEATLPPLLPLLCSACSLNDCGSHTIDELQAGLC